MNPDPLMVKLYSGLNDQSNTVPSGLNHLELSRLLMNQVNAFIVAISDGTYGPQQNRVNTAMLLGLSPEIRNLISQEDSVQFDRIVMVATQAWKAAGQPDRTHNKTLIQGIDNYVS